jgi:two-component system cell cycle sensor histidine kinase PleC
LGPALAGAAIAFVLAREFERTDRARTALHAVLAMGEAHENNNRPAESETGLKRKLADAERRAEQAEQAKAVFASTMSHKLFTPLNAIIGFSDMIKDGHCGPVGNPKYSKYASHIASAGRDLHAQITQILEYEQRESTELSLDIKALDIIPVLKECLEEIQGEAADRAISLEYEFAKMPLIQGDDGEIKRILEHFET